MGYVLGAVSAGAGGAEGVAAVGGNLPAPAMRTFDFRMRQGGRVSGPIWIESVDLAGLGWLERV